MPQGINTGEILEALNDKMDRDGHNVQSPTAFIIETYSNGTDWYRVWSDGYCEQYGQTPSTESSGYEVTLLKPFIDTNYSVLVTCKSTQSTNNGWNYAHTLTTTSFKIVQTGSGAFWKAEGYIA